MSEVPIYQRPPFLTAWDYRIEHLDLTDGPEATWRVWGSARTEEMARQALEAKRGEFPQLEWRCVRITRAETVEDW